MTISRKIVLYLLGIPKTVIFNLRYFPFRVALKLPVWVSHRVWLMRLGGAVTLDVVRTGIVKIGFGDVGIFDQNRSRSIWLVTGAVRFGGKADIGHGSKISVSGLLSIGGDFTVSAESAIVAMKSVTIGEGVLVSWDCQIMDSDFHEILDAEGIQINKPAEVLIGNGVWLGCRSLVLKGSSIADGVIVAAASVVSGRTGDPYSIVAGSPAQVIKRNVQWRP